MDGFTELNASYSLNATLSLLCADFKSHIGHHGVIKYDGNNFFRVRVVKEFLSEAVVTMVDIGSCPRISKSEIFAPFPSLNGFREPPLGINCKLNVHLSEKEWGHVIFQKYVQVQIGN